MQSDPFIRSHAQLCKSLKQLAHVVQPSGNNLGSRGAQEALPVPQAENMDVVCCRVDGLPDVFTDEEEETDEQ